MKNKKRKMIVMLCILVIITCMGIAYHQFAQKGLQANPMGSITTQEFLAMDTEQFQSLLEKEGHIFIPNFSGQCDVIYERLESPPPSSKLHAPQQLVGVCVEQKPQGGYWISEVIAHPLFRSGDSFQKLDDDEAASLYLDDRITKTDMAADSFAERNVYYIFYGRNRSTGIQQLATVKTTMSLVDVKNQGVFVYDQASVNFALYCAPDVEMKEYLVGFQVPEEPRYTLLEETFFTSESTKNSKPYEPHEVLNQFIDMYAPSWHGSSLTGNTGSAYKLSPALIVKSNTEEHAEETISWLLHKLILKQQHQKFSLKDTLMLKQDFKNHQAM